MAKKENEKIATSLIKQAQPAHSRAHAHEGTADGLDIREDEHNYRKHSDKNLSLIGKSLDDFGAGRSIVADSTGAVIGGNGTLRAANLRGIPKRIIHTNGDELVVVVRDDIAPDDPRRAKLAIMDNSTTDSSEFDIEALQMDFEPIELENLGVALPEIEEVDFPDLASGEKMPFRQITFTLTNEQADAVDEACKVARQMGIVPDVEESGNANSNGNAIAAVVKAFLAGADNE